MMYVYARVSSRINVYDGGGGGGQLLSGAPLLDGSSCVYMR